MFSLVGYFLYLASRKFADCRTGSMAAGVQSWVYGGFTPAGGVFAVLTSIGMIGVFQPIPIIGASIIASLVTAVVAGVRKDVGGH